MDVFTHQHALTKEDMLAWIAGRGVPQKKDIEGREVNFRYVVDEADREDTEHICDLLKAHLEGVCKAGIVKPREAKKSA